MEFHFSFVDLFENRECWVLRRRSGEKTFHLWCKLSSATWGEVVPVRIHRRLWHQITAHPKIGDAWSNDHFQDEHTGEQQMVYLSGELRICQWMLKWLGALQENRLQSRSEEIAIKHKLCPQIKSTIQQWLPEVVSLFLSSFHLFSLLLVSSFLSPSHFLGLLLSKKQFNRFTLNWSIRQEKPQIGAWCLSSRVEMTWVKWKNCQLITY